MAFLDWSDDYLIGIAAIDHDHKTLFRLVNRLHDRIKANDGEDAVGEALAGLVAYIGTHFAREERYMDDCGYPDLVRHAQAHRDLTDTVNSLKTLYEDDPGQFKNEMILDFLKNWLTRHILKSDMEYRPYMTGAKKGRFMTD
ncbi:MAG TPA: bacteriohemerythrin [Rhodospirillales bacterium]|jgi:hemerythrin